MNIFFDTVYVPAEGNKKGHYIAFTKSGEVLQIFLSGVDTYDSGFIINKRIETDEIFAAVEEKFVMSREELATVIHEAKYSGKSVIGFMEEKFPEK